MTAAGDMGLDGLDGRLYALWASGFTRRWHMNPAMSGFEDYICSHQGRCGQLIITLFPDHSIELLRAAITHDAGESRVGDLSTDFKKCGGGLVDQHAALEMRVLKAMGFAEDLSRYDVLCLKFVDRLDAYLFVQLRRPSQTTRNGWAQAREWLVDQSKPLGCQAMVLDMLIAAQLGDFT